MAGPLAEKIVQALAHSYPDACGDALEDVGRKLGEKEEYFGLVSTNAMRLSRDYLAADARIHGGVILYAHHGGRVGDST